MTDTGLDPALRSEEWVDTPDVGTTGTGLIHRLACLARSAPAVTGYAIAMVYLPLTWFRFGLYDDLYNSFRRPYELFLDDARGARPIAGVFHLAYFGSTSHIDGFGIGRLIAALLVATQGALLARLLQRLGLGATAAALVSFAAHVTVGLQMVTAWGPTLFVLLLSSMAGGACGWMMWSAPPRAFGRLVIATLLGIAALSIYQPGGLAMVSVFALCVALDDRSGPLLRRLVRTGVRLVPVGIGYVIVMQICKAWWGTLGARNELAPDLGAKFDWLTDRVLPRVLAPFQLSPGGLVVCLVTLAAVLASAAVPGRPWLQVAGRAILVALLCLGTYASNLVVAESWESSRSLFVTLATTAALAGVGVWNITRRPPLRRWRTAWLLVGVVACVSLGANAMSNTISRVAEPDAAELRAVQAAARDVGARHPPAIVFVTATWESSIASGVSMDEFGYPLSAASWSIEPMVDPALDDVGFDGQVVVVTPGYDPSTVPAGAAVVDLGTVLHSIDHP